MSVSNTAGKIYDISEYPRLDAFLKEQQDVMDEIDKEKSFQTTKIIQYTMVLVGVVISLYWFSRMVNKKK
jgi:hypothetical protein